jgi:hypothetical protein
MALGYHKGKNDKGDEEKKYKSDKLFFPLPPEPETQQAEGPGGGNTQQCQGQEKKLFIGQADKTGSQKKKRRNEDQAFHRRESFPAEENKIEPGRQHQPEEGVHGDHTEECVMGGKTCDQAEMEEDIG